MAPVGDRTQQPHVVCVPYPSQGHVSPMMQLAKLLHSKGFHITFVNSEFNHRRLIRSQGHPSSLVGLPGFRFEAIPDGLPPSDKDATQDVPALSDSIRKNCLGPFKELLVKLGELSEVPPVTCIISDGVMGFGSRAAVELGIPEVQFWTASACGFMGYLQYSELLKRGLVPFKEKNLDNQDDPLDVIIDWIPGMKNVRLKDIPYHPNEIMFDFMGSEAQNCLKSSAIIFNTFDEFEHQVLEAISGIFPNIYTIIGPLPLLCRHVSADDSQIKSLSPSLWKEDRGCVEWLDKREPNSVVYVNYGSVAVMTEQHLKEFAWGLANSKHPFLWIVRADVVMGSDDSALLPPEYFVEIKDRGKIASWCTQEQVLAHPSVAVFLTHCGWNSILETVCEGVPVICWPFFADQQTNCGYACSSWGIGLEVKHDVKRYEIEALIKEMMEGEKGKELKQKALEWKNKAMEATDIGGPSYNNFERLIKNDLHYDG